MNSIRKKIFVQTNIFTLLLIRKHHLLLCHDLLVHWMPLSPLAYLDQLSSHFQDSQNSYEDLKSFEDLKEKLFQKQI